MDQASVPSWAQAQAKGGAREGPSPSGQGGKSVVTSETGMYRTLDSTHMCFLEPESRDPLLEACSWLDSSLLQVILRK